MSELRRVPLETIDTLSDKEPIPSVTGVIVDVYEYKHGENSYGPWSFQDATLSDGNTVVKLKAANMHDLSDLRGKNVIIESLQSKAHGLTGLTKLIDDYQGKRYHKIKLTGSCKIRDMDNDPASDEIPMEFDEEGNPIDIMTGKSTLTRKQEQTVRDLGLLEQNGVQEARKHIMRAVNLYVMCVDAVDTVIKPHIEGMTAELYQAAVGTLFIEASRAGFVGKMPDKKLK